jgi:hypothetical protein
MSKIKSIYTYSLVNCMPIIIIHLLFELFLEDLKKIPSKIVITLMVLIPLLVFVYFVRSIIKYKKNVGETTFNFKHILIFVLPISWIVLLWIIEFYLRSVSSSSITEIVSFTVLPIAYFSVCVLVSILFFIPFLFLRKKRLENKIDLHSRPIHKKIFLFIILLPLSLPIVNVDSSEFKSEYSQNGTYSYSSGHIEYSMTISGDSWTSRSKMCENCDVLYNSGKVIDNGIYESYGVGQFGVISGNSISVEYANTVLTLRK